VTFTPDAAVVAPVTELASLTRDLVSVPSHESEAAAGDRIESWLLAETDARVTRDEAGADEGRGGNVLARRGSGDTSLALVGHHDVVPPDDSQVTEEGGYVVEQRDGRLYGRGTADMKGAVAAAMLAFRDADPPAGVELVFASFVGEEDGGVGARAAVERNSTSNRNASRSGDAIGDPDDPDFAPDHAVVGEGSTGYSARGVTDVAVAHRGRRGSTVVARGAAAHASDPDAGENAIYRASDALDVLRDVDPPEAEVPAADATATGSVVATEIDGGSAWNVVPERCEVTVDERTVPGGRADLGAVEAVSGVEWRVDQDLPPMACEDAAFADAVHDAAAATQDGDPGRVLKPHATDAGWLSAAGTECVVVGPAEPGEAHTADESVSLAVLERCYEVYRTVASERTDQGRPGE
jgi:acetylornithine deacetylase